MGKKNKFLSRTKKVRHDFLYAGAKGALFLTSYLPRRFGLWLFGSIGGAVFSFPSLDKKRTVSHLKIIYENQWPERKIIETAREVYVNLGKNLFDTIYLSRLNEIDFNEIVKYDSLEKFQQAYEQKNGVIVITAHIGCFEMLLHFFALHGFKSFAIGRKMFDQRLEDLIRKTRSGDNIEYMDRTEGTIKIVRLLKQGKAFGVLIDQDTKVESVFASFLGYPALTPSGPVKLAMKFNIPVFVATTARLPDNTHYVYLSEPLSLEKSGDFESDLKANVEKANDLICNAIKKYPSQWVWMHRRWRRKPSN